MPKITVEVPDGEYCTVWGSFCTKSSCKFVEHQYCYIYKKVLKLAKGQKYREIKCPACLEACKMVENETHTEFVENQIAKWPEWKKDVAKRVLANEKACKESADNAK